MSIHLWEAICFVILVAFLYRPIKKMGAEYLDEYSSKIKNSVDEADALRAEAEKTLQYYVDQQKNFEIHKKTAEQATQDNIKILLDNAAQELIRKVELKKAIHKQRLSIYETEHVNSMINSTIAKSLRLTRLYLIDHIPAKNNADEVSLVLDHIAHSKKNSFN